MSQPALFLKPTIAMHRGETVVDQCSWCGALVAWEPKERIKRKKLGPYPACQNETWWRQDAPVGPSHAESPDA